MPTVLSHAVIASAAGQWWRRPLPRGFWAWTAICAMLPDADVIGFPLGIRYDDMFGHRGFTHSLFFAALIGALVSRHLSRRPAARARRPAARAHRPVSDSHQPGPALHQPSDLHQPGSDLHQPAAHRHQPASDLHHPAAHSHQPASDSHQPASHLLPLFLWFTAVTLSHGLFDALTNGGRGIGFLAPVSNHRYFFPWRPIQVSPIGVNFFSPRALGVLASEALWIWLPSAIMAASARLLRR